MMLLGVHKMLAAIDKLVPGAPATHPEINKVIYYLSNFVLLRNAPVSLGTP